MPRRIRDYRAEERRRNELAQQRGFRNRAEQRTSRINNRVDKAQEWSDRNAKTPSASYDLEEKPRGMSVERFTTAYLDAFVEGDEAYYDVRYDGGSDALEYWFVEVMEEYTPEEYAEKYGEK